MPGKSNSTHKKNRTSRGPRRTRSRKGLKTAPDGTTYSLLSGTTPATQVSPHVNDMIYKISQSIEYANVVTTSTSVNTYGAITFAASALDQVTSLAAVFDQYRIDEIEVWIEDVNVAVQNMVGSKYCSVLDFDDANNLTTFAQAQDYQNCVETNIQQGHYRRFKPHCAVAAYGSSFNQFENQVSPWIDYASTAVSHYGLKLACQPTPNGATAINVRARYHISSRNVR
jgi:hypothetical protein